MSQSVLRSIKEGQLVLSEALQRQTSHTVNSSDQTDQRIKTEKIFSLIYGLDKIDKHVCENNIIIIAIIITKLQEPQ